MTRISQQSPAPGAVSGGSMGDSPARAERDRKRELPPELLERVRALVELHARNAAASPGSMPMPVSGTGLSRMAPSPLGGMHELGTPESSGGA